MLLHRAEPPLKQSPSSLGAVWGMENERIMPPGSWTTSEIPSLLLKANIRPIVSQREGNKDIQGEKRKHFTHKKWETTQTIHITLSNNWLNPCFDILAQQIDKLPQSSINECPLEIIHFICASNKSLGNKKTRMSSKNMVKMSYVKMYGLSHG